MLGKALQPTRRASWLHSRPIVPSNLNSARPTMRHIAIVPLRSRNIFLSRPAPAPIPPHRLHASSPLHRHSSSSSPASPSTSFADPDRPELFYHLFRPPTSVSRSSAVFALSFLSDTPRSAESCAVLGWLPAEGSGESEEAGLNDFKENAKFLDALHEAVESGLRDGVDDIQINGAIQTQQGWMHIHDNRNVPALGRIGDPDDIIASVRVEDGKILPDTYQPMPSYRLCTSDGVLQLTEGLFERLKQVLARRVQEEAGKM